MIFGGYIKKIILFLCLTFLLASCQNKSLNPTDFDSEIFVFNEIITNFSDTLPDKNQHFIFDDLQKKDKTYEMRYKINQKIGLLLVFDNSEKLTCISFGNIESNKTYKYSELGIVPTALMLTILSSDSDDNTRQQIAEFLTNCNEDKTIVLSDSNLGEIKMVKDKGLQKISIYFNT